MDVTRPRRRFGVGDVVAKKYRILHELGAGGAAHVFLAVARGPVGFHKLVVLKVPKPHLAGDPDFQRMFTREAQLAARLNHPNIVQTFEVVTARGLPVIVMEYLEGQPLSAILSAVRSDEPRPAATRNLDFPLAMHLRVLVDALNGLHFAHELTDYDGSVLGVVHRDMSPHNVFVTFQGEVKVLDFGVAKLAEVEAETRTVRGKLRYMPPEQLGCRRVDRRADIFAVGVMLWEAMVGQRLWKGRFNEEIRRRVLNGDIPPPSRVRRDVPPELEAICLRALAHDPEARPATAADLGRELEQFLSELGPPVPSRQLGRTVSLLFQNLLRQHRLELDSQLIGLSLRGGDRGEPLFTDTSSGQSSSDSTAVARRWNARRAAVVALGGLGAVLVTLGVWSRRFEHVHAVASAPAVVPSASAPGARSRRTVRVQVRANPAESRLYFDHTLLPTNPVLRAMLADGQPHLVRAEADGYGAAELRFVLETDLDLSLTLEPGPSQRPRPTSPAMNATHPQPSARPGDLRCNPPFVVDSRGVKVFLPECL